MLISEESQSAK